MTESTLIEPPATEPSTAPSTAPLTASDARPGRTCPIDYRYRPQAIAAAAPLATDCAWIAGGLYGNPFALDVLEAALAAEPGPATLVLNGDFHWFDAQPDWFDRIQRRALAHQALRGNVETECARAAFDPAIGCGCAYPDHVGDGVVDRSNRILAQLWQACAAGSHAPALARLPMHRHLRIGDARIGVVHGDLESLAGWSFDADALRDPAARQRTAAQVATAELDLIASSHTCAPVITRFAPAQACEAARAQTGTLLINNGAAGMANFHGDGAGVATRVALEPLHARPASALAALRLRVLHARTHAGVWVEAVALDFDRDAFWRAFVALWPAGSDAHVSYAQRILQGTSLQPQQAYGQG